MSRQRIRNRKKCIFLVFSVLLAAAALSILAYSSREKKPFGLAYQKVGDALEELQGRERMEPLSVFYNVLLEGKTVPYDIDTNTFYVCQVGNRTIGTFSLQEDFDGRLTLCGPTDDVRLDDWIRDGSVLTLLWQDDSAYAEFNLILSGLPICNLSKGGVSDPETSNDGHFTLQSISDGRSYVWENSACDFHRRGASNFASQKGSYRLSLKTNEGLQNKVSLLQMRRDEDWILNSLYSDPACVHSKVCWDIWNAMCAARTNGKNERIKGHFVELIKEGNYKGIYYLMEVPDAKEFHLGEGDYLFRTRKREEQISEDEVIDFLSETGEEELDDHVKWKYPKDQNPSDRIMYGRYLHMIYEGADSNEAFSFDTDNVLDYTLFVEACNALDNQFKNCNIILKKENDKYLVRIVPWDLDMTLGVGLPEGLEKTYGRALAESDTYLAEYDELLSPFARHLSQEQLRKRWRILRSQYLLDDYVIQTLRKEWDILENSGAAKREEALWRSFSLGSTEEELEMRIEKHLADLDQYLLY